MSVEQSWDLIVVGAGPAGMAAAAEGSQAGMKVLLVDNGQQPGGQIWRNLQTHPKSKAHRKPFEHWLQRLQRVELRMATEVVDAPRRGELTLVHQGQREEVSYQKLVLATGARERFLPFPGWTKAGVFGAGAMQALLKSGLQAGGKRVVVAGSGPLLLAVAASLSSAGARVCAILEQAPLGQLLGITGAMFQHPAKLVEGAQYRMQTLTAPYRTSSWVTAAQGGSKLESVSAVVGGNAREIACDWLACGFHLVANLELPRLLGCQTAGGRTVVSGLRESTVEGIYCVGEVTGIGGMEKAILEGRIAALAAAGKRAEAESLAASLPTAEGFARALDKAFALRPELRTLATPETILCRCEDATVGAVQRHGNWRAAKLYTRNGMGACQGRTCGTAAEFLFDWQSSVPHPPLFPVPLSVMVPEEKSQG